MTKYIDTDLLCKDILSQPPQDIHSLLRTIENQPVADVVDEIIELLTELKDKYLKEEDMRGTWAIRYAISLIEEKFKKGTSNEQRKAD